MCDPLWLGSKRPATRLENEPKDLNQLQLEFLEDRVEACCLPYFHNTLNCSSTSVIVVKYLNKFAFVVLSVSRVV